MKYISQKLHSVKQIINFYRTVKVQKMGKKILLLAGAPCVKDFFENADIREQFREYDLAFINYMILQSKDDFFRLQPKYVILYDPIFYQEHVNGNDDKKKIEEVLNEVTWECYIVTSVFGNFNLSNDMVHYIRLSCFGKKYNTLFLPLYKRNWLNLGVFNVVQASLYFAITYGYEEIAILGCNYQMAEFHIVDAGIEIINPLHYYDNQPIIEYVEWEKINNCKNGYVSEIFKRGMNSAACFWNINKYAKRMNANILNYSDYSALDAFKNGKLYE